MTKNTILNISLFAVFLTGFAALAIVNLDIAAIVLVILLGVLSISLSIFGMREALKR